MMNSLARLRGRRSALPGPTRGPSDDPQPLGSEAVALISRAQRALRTAGTANLPALAQQLVDAAVEHLRCIGCALFLADEPARQLIPLAHAKTGLYPPQALPCSTRLRDTTASTSASPTT